MIIRAFERGAFYPTPLEAVHTVTYLCDILATAWGLQPLSRSVLKTSWVPRSSSLQAGLDRLVGMGLVEATSLEFQMHGPRHVLQADYGLIADRCAPVFAVLDKDPDWAREYSAIGEITYVVAAMGRDRVPRAVLVDASYNDPLLDSETVLDLRPDTQDRVTRTEAVGRELARIGRQEVGRSLTPAELTGIYVRHLYALSKDIA
jgi:hypothetical protein